MGKRTGKSEVTEPQAAFDAAEIDALGYEAAVERLELIIEAIESGEVGLEASIAKYEEGAALLKRCRTILGQSEQRIEHLEAQITGDVDADAGSGAP
jgi:exodeoxyribonuclease VII small subunit